MKIIVGLGNPGIEYENTRHNAGYLFVDSMLSHPYFNSYANLTFKNEAKFDAMIAEVIVNSEKYIFVKPLTYMNLSGSSVSKILAFYKVDASDLIVVSDDVDLPLGASRIRAEGSSGGQKGLQNIIDQLGHNNFVRVRIGIKSDNKELSQIPTSDFVLGKFSQAEKESLEKINNAMIEYILPFLVNDQTIIPHTIQT